MLDEIPSNEIQIEKLEFQPTSHPSGREIEGEG